MTEDKLCPFMSRPNITENYRLGIVICQKERCAAWGKQHVIDYDIMLFKCTGGDVTCGQYFNCMDLIARKPAPCGSRSPECLDNALRNMYCYEEGDSDD